MRTQVINWGRVAPHPSHGANIKHLEGCTGHTNTKFRSNSRRSCSPMPNAALAVARPMQSADRPRDGQPLLIRLAHLVKVLLREFNELMQQIQIARLA